MERPVLLPTSARSENFAGLVYPLDGELVPALTVVLLGQVGVVFNQCICDLYPVVRKRPSILSEKVVILKRVNDYYLIAGGKNARY